VIFPSGAQAVFDGVDSGPHAQLKIRNLRMVTRVLASGDIGFAESYMAGEWDTPDLSSLLALGAMNADALSHATAPSPLMRLVNRLYHAMRANTRKGSRRNIASHYDLGNDFYAQWLDKTMTYSSAIFTSPDEDIVAAQRRKYRRLAEKLELSPGERVLEIGCGWGGFAEIAAAEYGCHVVGLTLSVEQAAYARERMQRAGISDSVDIRIQDYRDVEGQFDKIVSIEMFEAVGEKYWPGYLRILHDRLTPGGKAALQIITINDRNFENYRNNPDFIQRYIFPGGMLPGPKAFENAVRNTPFEVSDSFYFGKSYAETLRRWDRDFQRNWPRIAPLGFDERFYRMWRYYLCYCEAGFDTGGIDVAHFLLERP
jgi:cyclopropane-fatty-acyl-phospholipid synthase